MGYLNMEDKTKEAIDEDGWLHSGDQGKHDKDGFLFITGRIKGNTSPGCLDVVQHYGISELLMLGKTSWSPAVPSAPPRPPLSHVPF